jgi:serine/threonine-protein kinase
VACDALKLGQYALVEHLGSGGMGEVHGAEHRLLRRPCAVKLFHPEHAGNPEVLRRFEREVQVTATLTHPNTVAIYDDRIADDGTFYNVMEYLPGLTIEQDVTRDGPMDAARAVHVLRQVADADANSADLTQAGMIVGTPACMSPEQCAGEEQPGPASDVYSLGALGYFLVTGQAPFEGRPPLPFMLAHLHEAPPSARVIRPDVPDALDAVLQRCLAKRPQDRSDSAKALERALAAAVA